MTGRRGWMKGIGLIQSQIDLQRRKIPRLRRLDGLLLLFQLILVLKQVLAVKPGIMNTVVHIDGKRIVGKIRCKGQRFCPVHIEIIAQSGQIHFIAVLRFYEILLRIAELDR